MLTITTLKYVHVPVVVVEVGQVGDVGDRAVPDEEGALPVHVLHVGTLLAGLQCPPRELLELVLPAVGVLRLGQPLHLVHQLVRDTMVQQLQERVVDSCLGSSSDASSVDGE